MEKNEEKKEMSNLKSVDVEHFILKILIPYFRKERYITPRILCAFLKGYFRGANTGRIPIAEIDNTLIDILTRCGEETEEWETLVSISTVLDDMIDTRCLCDSPPIST